MATLGLLDGLAEPPPSKPGAKVNPCAWERLAVLTESAGVRRDAGDRDGARSALARSARYLEMNPELLALQRGSLLQDIRTRLGDVEGAVRTARSLPPEQRDTALSEVAGSLARRGDIARAMEMATSIESPDGRMLAFIALAEAISERQNKN